ncbi:MAG: VTT domain-containing protein [Microgenomates group bacterium]|jgi:uncharacterized membrane protein YdjX (TVP38/TMEM64 family)
MIKQLRNQLFPLLATLVLILGLYLLSSLIPEENIQKMIIEAGIFAPIVYVMFTLITYIIAPLSTTPLIFVGFRMFGQEIIVWHMLATVLASVTNFWIARKLGRGLVIRLVGKSAINQIDKLAGEYGLQTLFVLRVFQGGIHDFISYAAGLTSIKFWPYFIISTIGMIPGNILWYIFSATTQNPLIFTLLTLGLATVFSGVYIFALYLQRKFK